MTTNVPVLPWKQSSGGGGYATFSISRATDNTFNFYTAGTDTTGRYAPASYCIIDNSGNVNNLTCLYNGLIFNTAPFTRKTIKLDPEQLNIQFLSNGGTSQITFTTYDPGLSDEVDEVAINSVSQSGGTPDTWNPNDKGANITLSNGNLTLAAANSGSVRTVNGKTTGKFYFEHTCNTNTFTPGTAIGVANPTANLTTQFNNAGEAGFTGVGDVSGGWVYQDVSHVAITWGPVAAADVIGVAVDLNNKLLWIRRNGGTWNPGYNGLNTGDPAAAVNGISIPDIAPLYPMIMAAGSGIQFTSNFGATAFANVAPTGYTGGWK